MIAALYIYDIREPHFSRDYVWTEYIWTRI